MSLSIFPQYDFLHGYITLHPVGISKLLCKSSTRGTEYYSPLKHGKPPWRCTVRAHLKLPGASPRLWQWQTWFADSQTVCLFSGTAWDAQTRQRGRHKMTNLLGTHNLHRFTDCRSFCVGGFTHEFLNFWFLLRIWDHRQISQNKSLFSNYSLNLKQG